MCSNPCTFSGSNFFLLSSQKWSLKNVILGAVLERLSSCERGQYHHNRWPSIHAIPVSSRKYKTFKRLYTTSTCQIHTVSLPPYALYKHFTCNASHSWPPKNEKLVREIAQLLTGNAYISNICAAVKTPTPPPIRDKMYRIWDDVWMMTWGLLVTLIHCCWVRTWRVRLATDRNITFEKCRLT